MLPFLASAAVLWDLLLAIWFDLMVRRFLFSAWLLVFLPDDEKALG